MWKKKIIKNGAGHGLSGKHIWKRIDFKEEKEYEKRGLKSITASDLYLKTCDLYVCDCGEEIVIEGFGFV